MNLNRYIAAAATLLFLGTSGCKDDFDINTDPNNAADVEVNLLLPSAEGAIGYAVGNVLQIYGGIWGQYWTQNPSSSQYRDLERYNPAPSDFNDVWTNLNSDALEDLQRIIDKSSGVAARRQYEAVATLLKAYTVQLSTDLFGDIPYTEALKGDKGILNPRYDAQEVVYDSLVALVDRGLSLIDPDDPNHPGTDDLIYGGDMEQWQRFGNTLKLKIGLRLSEVNPTKSRNIVASLEGAAFIGSGETAAIAYSATGGNQNPLYSAIAGPVLGETQNLVASSTAIGFFNNNNDPRVEAFFSPADDGSFVGIRQGNYANVRPGTPVAIPSPATGGAAEDPESATAPVKLISDYESKFLQAEAAVRGLISGDAAALYEEGIADSFDAYGLEGLEDYYSQPTIAFPAAATVARQLEAVVTQKWAAMCGNQNIEAWIEWRRTGYPSFFTPSVASVIGADRVPQIFLYPTEETTRNSNTPSQHQIYDRVYWDVR